MPRLRAEEELRSRSRDMTAEEIYRAVLDATGDKEAASNARADVRLRDYEQKRGLI